MEHIKTIDKKSNRVVCLDCLRVIASFAVVLIHVSAWFALNRPLVGVNCYNILGDMVRWCVPIFVMISGALFLDSKKDIKEIYQKNIYV